MDSRNQADCRRLCEPDAGVAVDDAVLVRDQRLSSRNAALDFVRSLPDDFADSTLALFLGREFNLLAVDRLGQGNAADCAPRPMRLAARGAKLGATGFILVHHAPARILKPTPGEFAITREIRRAGEDLDVHLLDHLILTSDRVMDINP